MKKNSRAVKAKMPTGEEYKALKKGLVHELDTNINEPPGGCITMVINPLMADVMLERNSHNRPFSTALAKDYQAMMERGHWRYTHQPILFDVDGKLQDGQHRLAACKNSGVPLKADVWFGAEAENFAFIDVGKKRSAGDLLAIQGVKNYNTMASICRFRLAEQGGNILRAIKGSRPNEIMAAYMPEMQDSAPIYKLFAKVKLCPPRYMAGLHYLCSLRSKLDADRFFAMVAEGIGIKERTDPAFRLRRRLEDNVLASERLRPEALIAITIKAWNAYRDKKTLGTLRYTPGERLPRIK